MNSDRHIIVGLLLVGVVILAFFFPPWMAFGLLAAVSFGTLLLGSPRVILYLYLGYTSIQALIDVSLLRDATKYVNDGMALILWVLFFTHQAFRRFNFAPIKNWWKIISLFLGYVVFVWLVNRSSSRGAWQFFSIYLSFIPFFILAQHYMTRKDVRVIIIFSVLLFWLNVILNVGWFFRINPLWNEHLANNNMVDVALGSLGSCSHVAYFCCMLFFLVFALLRHPEILGKKWRRPLVVTLLAIIVQLYFTFTNHAYVLFAAVFIPFVIGSKIYRKWYVYGIAIIAVVGAGWLISTDEQWRENFSEKNLIYRYDALANSAKVQLFGDLLVKNFENYKEEWLLGVGPGNGMGSIGKDNFSPFAVRMLLSYYKAADFHSLQMDSISGNTTSAVFTLWGDLGAIGSLLFFLFFIAVFKKCISVIRGVCEAYKKMIAEFLCGAFVFFSLVNVIYDLLFYTFFSIWIWLFVTFLYLPEEIERPKA